MTPAARAGRRALAAPAVHFALGGALLFLVAGWRDGGTGERPRLIVPAARLAAARRVFEAGARRPPTPAEAAAIERRVLDEEVLLQHALDLGLAAQGPVERRLALLAEFVGEAPAGATTRDLGRDDMVVRRILVDSVRRLIRGAVTRREPSEEALAAYLDAHPDRFRRPEALRLAIAGARSGEVEELPLLARRDLERRFGLAFVEAVDRRVAAWQGPFPSHEGALRVAVREHLPPRTSTLDEARDALRAAVAEELAERWLAERTAVLRSEMGAVVEGGMLGDLAEGGRS